MKTISLLFIIFCLIIQGNQTNSKEIIKDAFLTWTKETNKISKEFCTKKQCAENMKPPYDKYNCSLMLKEDLPMQEIIFEDINEDGILDGIITADYEPCQFGTWFINCAIVGHLVFFISNSETSFKIIEEPKIIREEIKFGRVQSVKNGVINAKGADQSSQAGAHEFDVEWSAKFQYKNGDFKLIY